MKYSKMYSVSGSKKIVIDLPENFQHKAQVLVIIDDEVITKEEKVNQLKEAINDPLFVADMNEVNQDFEAINNDTL